MVTKKLMKVQQELKAPKNQKNEFGGYKYRSCADILEAAKPLLKKNDLTLIIKDDVYQIGDRYYIKATATIYETCGDETQQISATAYAREEETKKGMDAAQITGSASSYARKYALNGLFSIDDTDDPDATNDHGKAEEKKETKKATKATKASEPEPERELLQLAEIFCADCGKTIKSWTSPKGSTFTPEEIAELSLKKTGRRLCIECASKAKPKEDK